MNVLGAVKQAAPIDTKSYNSIIISNVPSSNDKGAVPPNPTKPWLEMQTSESDPVRSAYSLTQQQKKRKPKGKDSDDSVTCYHLSQVELDSEDKKKTFHVLLDNVLYGPFNRIRYTIVHSVHDTSHRIAPCSISQEEILNISFMTFMPVEFPF